MQNKNFHSIFALLFSLCLFRMMKAFPRSLFLVAVTFLAACSTDIDLNAPEKDIWVVYSVLNQGDTVQYVRVSRVFLPESDALQYAKEFDQSVKGLNVKLTGNNQTYLAVQIDSVPKNPQDGTFYPYTTLYKISTAGNRALAPGKTYNLEITRPGTDTFFLKAQTLVPERVRFLSPSTTPGPGQQKCLRQVMLELDYKIEFSPGNGEGFENRVYLDYTENNVPKTVSYGPTDMYSENFRCTTGATGSTLCYQFREYEIIQGLYNEMQPQDQNIYVYDVNDQNKCKEIPENLPKVFRFEVTAMDKYLSSYRRANDPKFTDFNTVRPEYSNITASEGSQALGIFGSYTTEFARARLSPCAEYLLHLNNVEKPESPCEL
ncbi:MAG: DUF4249 family protein [Bacteroidetes bacterium]|nr:MAG: DUF4249 family protein [Bacteroidota bacterium]